MNRFCAPLVIAASLLGASAGANAADYYFRKMTAAVVLSDFGGVPVTVHSVNVPAGTWIVQAKTSLVNFGAADFTRCIITVGGVNQNGAGTMIGQADGMPALATISNLALVTTTATKPFKLTCVHDASIPGQYVDADGAMLVMRAPGTF